MEAIYLLFLPAILSTFITKKEMAMKKIALLFLLVCVSVTNIKPGHWAIGMIIFML